MRESTQDRGSGWSRLLFAASGVLGGIWIGSRSVKIYDWRTEWTIPAPLPVVYGAMTSRGAVREWWPDMELERRLRETVEGDLSGVLETIFQEQDDGTHITFSWYVRVTNPALNLLGYVAERMYRHSHDHVMESGENGLSEYCLRRA